LRAIQPFGVIAVERFSVKLLHHAEAPEFVFVAVPIALVIAVFGRELAAGDLVDHLHSGDDLDRERQLRSPAGLRQSFICEIETGRRHVFDQGAGAGVVVPLIKQIGLQPAGEIQKLVGAVAEGPKIIGPQDALGTVALHVNETNRIDIRNRRRAVENDGVAPPVAALIDPNCDPPRFDIHQVGQAVAIHVAEQQALWVEADAAEDRRIGKLYPAAHRDAPAPTAVAQVGPVVHAARVDKDDVLQTIAAHVGELYPRVGEVNIGEPVKVVAAAGLNPGPAQFAVMEIQLKLGTRAQDIGDAVAVEIEQAKLRVVQRKRWRRGVFDELPSGVGTGHCEWDVPIE
jgi:hypothetical protein